MPQIVGIIVGAAEAVISIFNTVKGWVEKLNDAYNAIVDNAVFQAALKAHKIALFASQSYRDLWSDIHNEVINVSRSVFGTAYLLSQTIHNGRDMVYNISGLLGEPIDVAEGRYIKGVNNFLKDLQFTADGLSKHPHKLFAKWDGFIGTDKAGNVLEKNKNWRDRVWEGFERGIKFGGQLSEVQESVNRFTNNLPSTIRSPVLGIVQPLLDALEFVEPDKFEEFEERTAAIFGFAELERLTIQGNLTDLLDRLKNPIGYLEELNELDALDKRVAEQKLADMANRELNRNRQSLQPIVDAVETNLPKIDDLVSNGVDIPQHPKLEEEFISQIQEGEIDNTKTWFVGDW